MVGWAGMRGAISLAAALALPTSFAERDLVLFLTFAVIVATLVGQGLTLPRSSAGWASSPGTSRTPVLAAEARRRLAVLALARIDDLAAAGGTPDDVTERVRTGYEALLAQVDRRLDLLCRRRGGGRRRRPAEGETRSFEAEVELRRLVIELERDELDRMVARRRVSQPVAADVRAALDIDETTMRP